MAVVSILDSSELNYRSIILHFVLHGCSRTPERTGARRCLISPLWYVSIIKMHYYFSFQIQWGSLLPCPQVLEILKPAWRNTNAPGEAGPVFSTQSWPVTGATTMHYPAVMDRVGLGGPGSWGSGGGPVIGAPFPTTCGEKGMLCRDWLWREF